MAEAGVRARGRALGREDWIRAAIDAVVRGGSDALRIDRLCDELHVTKGSFYHHFASRDELVDAMAAYWVRSQTEEILGQLGDLTESPLSKLKTLVKTFADLDIGTRDHAMRAFGASEPKIAHAVDEADQMVLAALEKILLGLGATTPDARIFARMMVLSAIGFYTAPNLVRKTEAREIRKRILEMMMEYVDVH